VYRYADGSIYHDGQWEADEPSCFSSACCIVM
jgi:hypothetical protein